MDYKEIIKILKRIADVDTIKELSDVLNVNYATFNTWAVRGEIPLKRIREFSEKLGVNIYTITNGNTKVISKDKIKRTNNSSSIFIRYFPDIYANASLGNENENESFQFINIDKTFLTEVLGVPYKTQYDVIKIFGNSMEPFIQNSSFIIIDTTKNTLDKIRNGDVVIFRKDSELFCKRILKSAFDDDIIISSDKVNFDDKKVKKTALREYIFIGVVVCSCNVKMFLN